MSNIDLPFGDYEDRLVGYLIYAHNGYCLIPVRKDQQNLTVNTMWSEAGNEFVWSVDQANELIEASVTNNWTHRPDSVRKAIYYKENGNIHVLDTPIKIGHLLRPVSMRIEQVNDEKKMDYRPTWDVESEIVELAIYGCKVTIEITSRGEGDVKQGVEWVKRAIQTRLDILRQIVEEDR